MRAVLLSQMQQGVFFALPHDLRAEYVQDMLSALDKLSTVSIRPHRPLPRSRQDEVFVIKQSLAKLPVDADTLIAVLAAVSEPLEGTAASQKKRLKHEEG